MRGLWIYADARKRKENNNDTRKNAEHNGRTC